MAKEFQVKVYEDHYLVSEGDRAPFAVSAGELEAALSTGAAKRKKGPARKRRTKAEIEAAKANM